MKFIHMYCVIRSRKLLRENIISVKNIFTVFFMTLMVLSNAILAQKYYDNKKPLWKYEKMKSSFMKFLMRFLLINRLLQL